FHYDRHHWLLCVAALGSMGWPPSSSLRLTSPAVPYFRHHFLAARFLLPCRGTNGVCLCFIFHHGPRWKGVVWLYLPPNHLDALVYVCRAKARRRSQPTPAPRQKP